MSLNANVCFVWFISKLLPKTKLYRTTVKLQPPNNSYTLNNPRYNIIPEKKFSRGPPKSLQSSQHEIKSPLKDKYTPYISFSFFLLGFYLYHDNYLHNALRDWCDEHFFPLGSHYYFIEVTATQTNSTSPNRLTPTSDKQNFYLQDQYNNKQKIDEKKKKPIRGLLLDPIPNSPN